ncbi:MAG TPA: hypothetical protein VGH38_08735, partial [Bryobacteraceae bacterium]
ALSRSGIYFLGARSGGRTPLMLYRFGEGKTEKVGAFEKTPFLHLSVSPDEKWVLYTQMDSVVEDLLLVENFQ